MSKVRKGKVCIAYFAAVGMERLAYIHFQLILITLNYKYFSRQHGLTQPELNKVKIIVSDAVNQALIIQLTIERT